MAEVEVGAVVPETPVAAPEATPAPDTTADQVEEQPEAKPERTFTQKELDEIVQKRLAKDARRSEKLGEERARREAAERELERIRSTPPVQQPQSGRPNPEDSKYQGRPYHEFAADLARWEARQEFDSQRQHYESQRQQEAARRQAEDMRARLQDGAAEFEDFEEVALGAHVPITDVMARAITESELPAKLAYYLGQNVKEAARIAQLPATRQVRELAKIEDKLSAAPEPSRTPPPIVPNGTKTTVAKDPSKMTDKEFADWRRRQIAQKR